VIDQHERGARREPPREQAQRRLTVRGVGGRTRKLTIPAAGGALSLASAVAAAKKTTVTVGRPTANMWCAQTPKPRKAISMPEYTITG